MTESASSTASETEAYTLDKTTDNSLTHNGNLSIEEQHERAIERVVSRLSQGYGALGPLEQPYDLQKISTHPDSHATFHEADQWKYPVDKDTGLRLVVFVEGDKVNPKNFGLARKWMLTGLLGLMCLVVALGSAIVTGDLAGAKEHFGVSMEVTILASVTMFVIGFGVGPCLFAPLSEQIGRKWVYTSTLFFALIFIIPCAVAKNIQTLIVCRLIDGIFFSAPMTLIGGSLADIWEAKERGQAMAIFSAAPFLGPVLGPVLGALVVLGSSWSWVYWAFLIIASVLYVVFTILVPETHANTLLKSRAAKLRKLTGDDSYKSISELKVVEFSEMAKDSLLRPFALLGELIVLLITLYMSVIYGLLYMFFFAYPVVYGEGKGWSDVMVGVMFLPIGIGILLATAIAPYVNKDYNRRAQVYRDRGEIPPPEFRLIPMMFACWSVPIGLFAFAWSSYPHVSWAGPAFSGVAVGFGFCALYNPANNYIVDSYQHYAASGLAAKTLVRSIWGACVPLFTIQMYHKLGYEWASTLMAFISLACCAIPFFFYIYGARIRKFSKYAWTPEVDAAK